MNGRCRYDSCQVGAAVLDNRTAVYAASGGAKNATPAELIGLATLTVLSRIGAADASFGPSNCRPALAPAKVPKQVRIHEPTDIGEVSFTVRIMLSARSGRPRSWAR